MDGVVLWRTTAYYGVLLFGVGPEPISGLSRLCRNVQKSKRGRMNSAGVLGPAATAQPLAVYFFYSRIHGHQASFFLFATDSR